MKTVTTKHEFTPTSPGTRTEKININKYYHATYGINPKKVRVKRTLDHMSEHGGNIKYDKYTGEIQ